MQSILVRHLITCFPSGPEVFTLVLWLGRLPALDPPVHALFIHATCSSPNRIGNMPLLDRLFIVSDSGFEGEIGIGVILIVELLTYAY